jgi:predicted regulator of Ras-like GTPase activity (Roadblock/LC7/MglB family)
MFGFLKNLLGKPAGKPEGGAGSQAAPQVNVGNPAAVPASTPAYEGMPCYQAGRESGHGLGKYVEVPLQSILTTFPLELQSRVHQPVVGDTLLSVPLERILPQLSHGAVRLSFGEVRQAFPEVFAPGIDMDRTLIALPLGEILPRINPNLLKRRRVQRLVEVPEDIASPFGKDGRGLAISKPDTKPPFAEPAAPVQPPRTAAPTPLPANGLRPGLTSAPTPPPPAAAPLPPHSLNSAPRIVRDTNGDHGVPNHRIAPKPNGTTVGGSNGETKTPRPAVPMPGSAPAPAQPAPSAQIPTVQVALTSLAEAWPEAVRREIVQANLVDAKLAIPADVLERALRLGRIAFTWRMVRGWIKPTPPTTTSTQDSTVLELPLRVVAPLFLAYQRGASKPTNKVKIDESIPNLFFGFPQPEGAPGGGAATAKPADTNFYVWDDQTNTVREEAAPPGSGPSAGTKFVSKYATPNEIVSRAAALDGVTGALIALPDGLSVASQIPPEFNPDTLAAFLPQIFGKVTQCTKELRMGELNNLNFTVGNVPWKIFRVNAIFFAAFGKAGEPLPTAQLAALASELDHKPK